MKVLFLHGKESGPGGKKPTYLAAQGMTVINPALPADDFDESVRIAQAAFDQHSPTVVVGSSRGGAVAMAINSGSAGLVLLAPAWKKWGTAKTVKPDSFIIHSVDDEIIPFIQSRELAVNSKLARDRLIVIGDDHRLALLNHWWRWFTR
jgi:hypothetical protein